VNFLLWFAGWLGVALDLLAFPETFSIGARAAHAKAVARKMLVSIYYVLKRNEALSW